MNEKDRARAFAGSLLHLVLSEVAHARGRPLSASVIADRLVEKGEAVDPATFASPTGPTMRDAILLTVIPQALRLGVLVEKLGDRRGAAFDLGVALGPAGWTLLEAALVEKALALAAESSSES